MARGLQISVPNVNEVRQFYDYIAVFKAENRMDPYVEITAAPGYGDIDRILLRENVEEYVFIDPEGERTDWYRTAFISTFTGIQGELTPPTQGIDINENTGQPINQFYNFDGATFADGYGFDGQYDIPATGGSRTNRNPDGYGTKGYWDGVGGQPNSGIELLCTRPLTPRGECYKNKAVAMTRVMLKDIDPNCVTGDTLVTTISGIKQISEVKRGDELLVYLQENKEYSYQPVRELLVNQTKTGQLLELVTASNRRLRCTFQQPMITWDGEVTADQLAVGNKIPVNPIAGSQQIPFDPEETFYTIEDFVEQFPEVTNKVRQQVEQWLPLRGKTACTFARLLGFLFGNGHLTKDFSQVDFASDSIEELEEIQKDLNTLNIQFTKIKKDHGKVVTAKRVGQKDAKEYIGTTIHFVVFSTAFGKLISLLGCPRGDKAIQQYDLPQWILSNKWLLKQFLSGYYGADGCDVINSTGIRELNFSFNKDNNLDVTAFIEQWKQAFTVFGIPLRVREEPNSGAIHKDGVVTTKYVLVPECSEAEGIIRFASQIGICYHEAKKKNLALAAEYLRFIQAQQDKNELERQKVFKCIKDGLTVMQTVEELNPKLKGRKKAIVWNKYDRWIRGDHNIVEQLICNKQKINQAQRRIYDAVMSYPEEVSHGEVTRTVVKQFATEYEACGMTTKYQNAWALVKAWRSGRVPDFERTEYTADQYLEMENKSSTKAGAIYKDYPFEKWIKSHTRDSLFFEEIVEINKLESNEDVYDCKFDLRYMFAEQIGFVDCWAFNEDEVDMFLEASLADFNAEPTFTNFNWHDLEDRWLHAIALGAQVMALYAQGLVEVGREFVITDNGISFQPPAISGYIQSTASQLLQHYDQLKQRIKQNMKPRPQAVGLFTPLAIHPAFIRLRHLRERRLY